MKMRILTFHSLPNDSAVLQLYVISKALSEYFPNADVKIVDYCLGFRKALPIEF